MSALTPPVVPPMSPRLREQLYAGFAWLGGIVFLAFIVVGALATYGIDVPNKVTAALGVASALLNGIDVWLKIVARTNVPATGGTDEPLEPDPDIEGVG